MRILVIKNKVKTYSVALKNEFDQLIALGHELFFAANFSAYIDDQKAIPATIIDLPISSNPLKRGNFKAYKALLKAVKDYNIDYIYCTTPIGGILGRMVAHKTKKKVIYAAHGLLFFKGAPIINNTLYKLQEKIMAKWTDVIITINDEDYNAMSKIKKKKDCKIYMVHGAGVDVDSSLYDGLDVSAKRAELGVPKDCFMITSVGFLNKNKNQKVLIKALKKLNDKNVHYVICGEGDQKGNLVKLAEKIGVVDRVHFLGYRTDVFEIIKSSNLVAIPSFREGVPRVVLEAMNLGVPCIGSDTRGIRELIGTEFSKFLCHPNLPKDFSEAITFAKENPDYCSKAVERNYIEAKKYTSEIVGKELYEIFRENI